MPQVEDGIKNKTNDPVERAKTDAITRRLQVEKGVSAPVVSTASAQTAPIAPVTGATNITPATRNDATGPDWLTQGTTSPNYQNMVDSGVLPPGKFNMGGGGGPSGGTGGAFDTSGLDVQTQKQIQAQHAQIDQSYNSAVTQLNQALQNAISSGEIDKESAQRMYDKELESINQGAYRAKEQIQVSGQQRGILSSAQQIGAEQGAVGRAQGAREESFTDRNQRISDISNRIAQLTTSTEMETANLGLERDLQKGAVSAGLEADLAGKKFDIARGDFEYGRGREAQLADQATQRGWSIEDRDFNAEQRANELDLNQRNAMIQIGQRAYNAQKAVEESREYKDLQDAEAKKEAMATASLEILMTDPKFAESLTWMDKKGAEREQGIANTKEYYKMVGLDDATIDDMMGALTDMNPERANTWLENLSQRSAQGGQYNQGLTPQDLQGLYNQPGVDTTQGVPSLNLGGGALPTTPGTDYNQINDTRSVAVRKRWFQELAKVDPAYSKQLKEARPDLYGDF